MYSTIILDNNAEAKRIDGSLWNLYGILFDRYRNDKYIRVELNKIIVITCIDDYEPICDELLSRGYKDIKIY